MLDILEMRVHADDLEQLRECQRSPRTDCQAAFTVRGKDTIWPLVTWDGAPSQQQVNVRGWFPLLDQIADEFLIWRPQGGPIFIGQEGARYRLSEDHRPGVEFLLFELNRPTLVTQWQLQPEAQTA